MKRIAVTALLALAAILLMLGASVVESGRGGVPAWARDLDCDGRVTMREWYQGGLDYGWRVAGPPGCMEAFRLKDGQSDVRWCGEPPICQGQLELGRERARGRR